VVAAVGMASARSGRRRSNSGADKRAHAVFLFFLNYRNSSNLEIEYGCLPCFQNFQFLHVARTGYYEQFSQLCQHPILNRIRVKNPGTDSTFEFLMNFKRHLNHLEKSDKFSKIPS
jgi:hypothetical protein